VELRLWLRGADGVEASNGGLAMRGNWHEKESSSSVLDYNISCV